jgi:pimeloyl-ACP methyl ester carboxylesterase
VIRGGADPAPPGFRSRWRTVGGLRLHGLESAAGHDPAVVLLPGLVTASRSMVPLARALAARGPRVRILDPPGFGYSDKPRRALPVRDLAALTAEWLAADGGRPSRVVGNSFGTQVAAAVAAGHPGAVGRLVLVSPTVSPRIRQRLSWLRALPAPARTRPAPSGRGRAALLARLHSAMGGQPPLRLLNVAEYGCASLLRAAGTLRCAVTEPIEHELPRVGVPVLVIRGDEDHLSSLDWAGRLAGLAPAGELARLPGLGHDAFYRAPDAVAAVAAPFLAAGADEPATAVSHRRSG